MHRDCREEISEQIKALNELKDMAKSYGYDISKPATNAREAVQWLYFAYLAAVKEQDGAAMSLGEEGGTGEELGSNWPAHLWRWVRRGMDEEWGSDRLTLAFAARGIPHQGRWCDVLSSWIAGRVDAFLDTFIEKDLKEGRLDEAGAQELIDQFIVKLRLVKHLRTPEYNDLFSGDPTW